jgi:hypothetical protein
MVATLNYGGRLVTVGTVGFFGSGSSANQPALIRRNLRPNLD